jgi:GT2 family glycosyltransferase
MPSVDVSIVTWNSAAVLQAALDSVFTQSLKPTHVFVVENGSTDGTRDVLARYPQCNVILQERNTGFAAGHNAVIARSTATFVLVMNPDVTLQADYLAKLCAFAEAQPRYAAFVGSIQRPDGTIDTTGLLVAPWRFARDRRDRTHEPRNVFGVSGAVALYRRAALLDVAAEGQYFNEMLFAYKEDVELAWRLQWAGWQSSFVPGAVAHHSRVLQRETRRTQRSADRRFLSYRNHLLLYPLAETWGTVFLDLWCIIPAELFRFAALLVTDPSVTLRALAAAAKMWHAARTFAYRERRIVRASQVRAAFHP